MSENIKKNKFKRVVVTWRERRLKAGMTQKEMANLVGVHEFTFSRWETGALNPSVMNMMEVESILTEKGQESRLFKSILLGKKS